MELDIPGTQHYFWVKAVGDVFYPVSMSGPRQVEDVPDSYIPRCVKLLTTCSKYIPESRSI